MLHVILKLSGTQSVIKICTFSKSKDRLASVLISYLGGHQGVTKSQYLVITRVGLLNFVTPLVVESKKGLVTFAAGQSKVRRKNQVSLPVLYHVRSQK